MSPTKTKKKQEAAAKKAPAQKPEEKQPEVPAFASPNYEAIADRIREELADRADLHLGGDIHAPNVVARKALDDFDRLRYLSWFQLIVELAYKDGHAKGRGV